MPRSGERARQRLRDAALELYEARGYDATTTAEIAQRAGVTERTYFRHFADKREVLFDGESVLLAAMEGAVEGAPVDLDALTIAVSAYRGVVPLVVAGRTVARRRAIVIAATPALQERALAKAAVLTDAVVRALERRGVPTPTARLAAQVAAAVFDQAAQAWNKDGTLDLDVCITRSVGEVERLGAISVQLRCGLPVARHQG